MVKIRLMRVGKRKQPSFRVVVADARSPRDGRFIENIGKYNPRVHPSLIDIDDERAIHWLQRGARPSDPVKVLFQKTGIWARFTGEPASTEAALDSEPEPSPPPSVTRGVPSGDDSGSASNDASTESGMPEAAPEAAPLAAEGDAEGTQPEAPDSEA
jgi:small subunit ribosomal protein S16